MKRKIWSITFFWVIVSIFLFSMIGKQGFGFEHEEDRAIIAKQGEESEKIGHYSYSSFNELAIRDDFVYISGYYNGFFVIDVSTKTNPVIIKHENIIGAVKYLTIENDYLYLVMNNIAWDYYLYIYDISTPSNPVKISETTFGDYDFYDVCAEDNYVYLPSNYGLCVLDVTNPATPNIINTTWFGQTNSVFIQNQTLYMNKLGFGINVFNVSTPASPELICEYEGLDSGSFSHFSTYNMFVEDDVLFSTNYDGLMLIDVADPSNLMYMNLTYLDWGISTAARFAISGDYIYLTRFQYGMIILHKNETLHITKVGEHDWGAGNLAIQGDFIYLTNEALRVGEITNPSEINIIGEVGEPYRGKAVGVQIAGDYAFLADYGGGLKVLDISDPLNPHKVGQYIDGVVKEVQIIGDYLYLGETPKGLVILDISDPENPIEDSYFQAFEVQGEVKNISYTIGEIFIQNDYAYISTDDNLLIFDVSNPRIPFLLGNYSAQDITRVFVNDNKGYIICEEGLHILDVKDKKNPKKLGNYTNDELGVFLDVEVAGKYAFLVSVDYLQVLDVGNPANIQNVSTTELKARGWTVTISGRYLCEGGRAFEMYDMNNPEKPVNFTLYWDSESSYCHDPWLDVRIQEIVVRDGYAYLAYADNGFVIIDLPVTKSGKIDVPLSFSFFSLVTIAAIIITFTRKKRNK